MMSDSPVDLEVEPMWNMDHEHIEYTFDLSEETIVPPAAEESNEGSTASTVAQKISKLEQRIADLEQRVAELEG